MAGKHIGAGTATGLGAGYMPGVRMDRAYSEGRQANFEGGLFGDNPDPDLTSPVHIAWNKGYLNAGAPGAVFETCWYGIAP
ncbi:MAG: hypothetical protein GY758_01025 [Fuerstiella sp.]|nr:hypothetical protein [Fuerstiella sp.]